MCMEEYWGAEADEDAAIGRDEWEDEEDDDAPIHQLTPI